MFAEGEARALYRSVGWGLDETPSPVELARLLLGWDSVVVMPGLSARATFVRATGQIWLRRGLSPRQAGWLVAHELAEWHLGRVGYEGPDREEVADHLAAALLLPRDAFRASLHEHGRHLPTLADAWVTTQSIVALRLGEVTGSPLALVSPRRVQVRGEPWGWPAEPELRRVVRAERLPAGLERLTVEDAPRRAVLVAA